MFGSHSPIAALTFDDGPVESSDTASQILDTLHTYHIKASFFYCGSAITKTTSSEILRAYKEGHEIGNHTYHHLDLTTLSKEAMLEEYTQTCNKLTQITGLTYFLTRAPYLSYNELLLQTLPSPLIGTSVDSKDWSGISASQIISHVLNHIHDGAIILMHENQPHTSTALPILIPQLLQLGYRLTTVSQMMQLKKQVLINGQVYNHA